MPTNGVVAENTVWQHPLSVCRCDYRDHADALAVQEVFINGDPLVDVAQIQVLPIYETLPNRDKQLTGAQRISKYLEPYFLGRFQLVGRGDELDIDGVDWRVVHCDPPRGLVTYKTMIYADGPALKAGNTCACITYANVL